MWLSHYPSAVCLRVQRRARRGRRGRRARGPARGRARGRRARGRTPRRRPSWRCCGGAGPPRRCARPCLHTTTTLLTARRITHARTKRIFNLSIKTCILSSSNYTVHFYQNDIKFDLSVTGDRLNINFDHTYCKHYNNAQQIHREVNKYTMMICILDEIDHEGDSSSASIAPNLCSPILSKPQPRTSVKSR